MSKVYLFDVDLIERKVYPTFPTLPNHALCKMTYYYKKKGDTVRLIHDIKQIPLFKEDDSIYRASALHSVNKQRFEKRIQNRSKKFKNPKMLKLEDIDIGTPLTTNEISYRKGVVVDTSLYDEMLKKTDKKLAWYPSNFGLLTRGCKRHCKFCMNAHSDEIILIDTIEDIYQKKGYDIELLDDNLFASPYAVQLLHKMAEFGKKEGIQFHMRGGLDFRVVPDDKLKALKHASTVLGEIVTAWDEAKNSYIFRNIQKVKETITNKQTLCYCITGVFIDNEEEMIKDLLGYFYRYYMLNRIGVKPVMKIFQANSGEYTNPYTPLYKMIRLQYYWRKLKPGVKLKYNLNPKYYNLADKIIELFPKEFQYLLTDEVHKTLQLPLPEFNKKMEQLANYLEIKHYPIINEKGG